MRLAAFLITTTALADCPPIDTCPWDLNQTHYIRHEPDVQQQLKRITWQLMLHQDGSISMRPTEPQAPSAPEYVPLARRR